MAWVTPTNVSTGDVLTASMWNQDVVANATELAQFFGAWTAWTPTLAQSSEVAKTVSGATYIQVGKLVIANFFLTVTGTGSAGSSMTVGLPVEAKSTALNIGGGSIFDASATTAYSGQWFNTTSTAAIFVGDWSGQNSWGIAPSIALATNDLIRGTVIYEAA